MNGRALSQRRRAWPALSALLALALAGCFGDGPPAVATEPVTEGAVTETVSAPARVDAAARQDVAAAVSGVVVALDAADGDVVEAGQVLVRLESSQVDLAREQAVAAEQAAAQVGGIRVDGQGRATTAVVNAAVADLDAQVPPRIAEARAQAGQVEDETHRESALAAIDAIETNYLTTRAGLLATGEALAAQQDGLARSLSSAVNQAMEQMASAQRAQAAAAARAAESQADDLTLAAPFAGVVQFGEAAATEGPGLPAGLPTDLSGLTNAFGSSGGGSLRIGAPVAAGQTVFTVFDLSAKYVNVDVDEVDAPAVAAGQRVTVLVDAFPELEFPGLVESVRVEAVTTETGGVGYRTRVRLLDGDDEAIAEAIDGMRVGMTASAEIETRTVDGDAVVPSRALLRRDDGTVVFVVRDGVALQTPVRVVALGEERAAVQGELNVGDEVVVRGYEGLRDGAEVTRE